MKMKSNSLLVLIAVLATVDIANAGLSKGPRASDTKKAKTEASSEKRAPESSAKSETASSESKPAEPERGFAEIPKDKVTPCREALEFYFGGGGSKCTAGLGLRFKEGSDNTRIWTSRHDFETIDSRYDGGRPLVIKGKEGPYFPVLNFEYDVSGRLTSFKCTHHNSSPSGPIVAGFEPKSIELEYDIDGPGSCQIKGATRASHLPTHSEGSSRPPVN